MKSLVIILTAIVYSITITAQEEARLMRFPSVSGDKVAFSYGGDLYLTSIDGGIARKITNHKGYEMFPRFSPDGKYIAFTAQYDGNTEVYVVPSDGGEPKRLTYTAVLDRDDIGDRMGPNNIVITWTPDSKNIIYRSRKQSFNDFKGLLLSVSLEGGLSKELPFSVGGFCSFSPDGKKLVYNKVFREFRTWKRYKGGMADDIRIFDFDSKTSENITNNDFQDIIPMWIGNEIYYLSDRDHTMNLFVYNTDRKQTEKVTSFTDFDIKFPSANGNIIVFEKAGYIYKLDAKTKKAEKLTIKISDDGLWARGEYKDASKYMRTIDVSPNGERVVISARGDIYSLPSTKGITRNLTKTPGVHERNVAWSPDGMYIAYLSDASGEFEIYIQKQDGSETPIQLTKNSDTYKFNIEWSPDSKKIVWADRKLKLQYVDINSKEIKYVFQSKINSIDYYNWSLDSRWIVFSQQSENRFSIISVYNTETGQVRDITDSWFDSGDPVFSSNGKYIVFVSARDFSPVYSQTEWNHAYINMSRVYLVLLKKDCPSPFLLENNEVSLTPENNKPDKPDKDSKDKADRITQTDIDFDNIGERIIALPVKPSNYSELSCVNDYVYYIENPQFDSQVFKMYDLKKQEEVELGKNMRYAISASKKKMLVKESDKLSVIDLPSSKITLKDYVNVSSMKVLVDYQQEWKQIFDEAWRQMRDFFYVENMHGLDWKAIHDKYAQLVPYVRHRDDLTYIIGEMIGELSIGHAYINSGEKPKVDRIPIGLLGAKISKHSSGYFRIDSIIGGNNWNPALRSPLTEPGVNVKTGDFIISIDGEDLKYINDLYKLLEYKADKEVLLTVNNKPEEKDSRKTLIKPLRSELDIYYYSWVQNNIRKVEKATNGEVGYVHIPDMVSEGLNEFAKYFYPQLNKKVLIIDDRGNGGGNVSPQIIERLQRELTRSRMFRNGTVPASVPGEMMLGPKIMLIDQYSASDGDLFPYAFKKHKLGTVIGQRTWGGVVGISASLPFIDGTDLRKPEFASYSADTSDWIIEGRGVEPDIFVENDPYREYLGIDDQLNKAIEIAKEQLKNYKPLPPIPVAPDKSK
jgi:tricorn protease